MAEVQIPEEVGILLGGDLVSYIVKAFPDDRNVRLWCRAARTARDASQTTLKVGRCMAWGPSAPPVMPLYRREDINCSYVLGAIRRGCRPTSFSLRGKYTHHQHTDTDGLKHARMLELVQSIPGALPPGSPPLPTNHLELHASVLSAGPAMAHAIAAAFPNLTHITLQAANVLTGARADAPAAAECLLHLLSSDPPPLPLPPPANPDPNVAMDADNQAAPGADAAPPPPVAPPAVPHGGPLLHHLTSLTVDNTRTFPPMLQTALLAATHVRELRCRRFDTSLRQPYALPDPHEHEVLQWPPPNAQLQQITQLHHLTSLRIETVSELLADQPQQRQAAALVHTLAAHLPGLQRLELPHCAGPLCVNDFAGLVHLRHLSVPLMIMGTQGLAAKGPLEHLTSLEVRALGPRQHDDNDAQEAALLGAAGVAGGAVQDGAGTGGVAAGAAGEAAAPVLPRLQRLVIHEARMQSLVVLARLWGHTCLRQLTLWTSDFPVRGLHDLVQARAEEAEDRAGGVGGIPLLAFSRREASHGRLTAVGEVALGRCVELLAGVQQRAGGAGSREMELTVQRGRRRREEEVVDPRAVGPLVGRHASWLSRLSGVRGMVRLRLCGLDLAHGDLQAVAAGLQGLQALRLDGCLFPTASLPVLAALRRLHTLTLDVGCWWGRTTSSRHAGADPGGPGAGLMALPAWREEVEEAEAVLGAPDRGPVPTADPQFLLYEAPWRLGNLCIMADQLQRVELWVEGDAQLGGQGIGAIWAAAVRAVCRSANQLLLQAVEQGNARLAVRAPVVEWDPPMDA